MSYTHELLEHLSKCQVRSVERDTDIIKELCYIKKQILEIKNDIKEIKKGVL